MVALRRWSVLGLLSLFISLPALGQSADQQSELETRVKQLSEQLEKQQSEIEQLRKTTQELLDQLRAAGAPKVEADGKNPEIVQEGTSSTAAPDKETAAPSDARAAQYPDWRGAGAGINIGDKVRVGGYGSFRFESNDVANGNPIPGGSEAGFTFRRFVLTTDARPASRLRIYSEVELERLHEIEVEKSSGVSGDELEFEHEVEGNAHGEVSLEQAWGQFNFAENHGVRGGIVLAPVGRFNLLHDDDYWDVPRRTLVDRDAPILPVKAAWRDLGMGLVGSFNVGEQGKLDYQVYALNGAALDFNIEKEAEFEAGSPGSANAVINTEIGLSSGFFDGSKSATAIAWRAAYSPMLNGEFAFSGYRGNYSPNFLSTNEPVTTLAYDHKWRWKNFETEGEFVYTSLGDLDRVLDGLAQRIFNSANEQIPTSGEGGLTKVEVETELSQLARSRYGFWTDFKYHARPQWLRNSFMGRSFQDPQIIPVVRYERVWLNDLRTDVEIVNGGIAGVTRKDLEQDRVTAGISYRPNLQFAIQAAFEHNRKLRGDQLIFPRVDQDSTNGFVLGMAFAF